MHFYKNKKKCINKGMWPCNPSWYGIVDDNGIPEQHICQSFHPRYLMHLHQEERSCQPGARYRGGTSPHLNEQTWALMWFIFGKRIDYYPHTLIHRHICMHVYASEQQCGNLQTINKLIAWQTFASLYKYCVGCSSMKNKEAKFSF